MVVTKNSGLGMRAEVGRDSESFMVMLPGNPGIDETLSEEMQENNSAKRIGR